LTAQIRHADAVLDISAHAKICHSFPTFDARAIRYKKFTQIWVTFGD
jgi:hypothetical protein